MLEENKTSNQIGFNSKEGEDHQTIRSGYSDYDTGNGSCPACEDVCGLACFPICLLFPDCQILELPLNHSGIYMHCKVNFNLSSIALVDVT